MVQWRRLRRRRLYHILGLLGIIGVVFLSFQLLSMKALNSQESRETHSRVEVRAAEEMKKIKRLLKPHERLTDTKDPNAVHPDQGLRESTHIIPSHKFKPGSKISTHRKRDRFKIEPNVGSKDDTAKQGHEGQGHAINPKEVDSKQKEIEEEAKAGVQDKNIPRGVSPLQKHLYVADNHGDFTCINSKEKITFSQVNDDYCDCKDQTDEPGTSACQNSRFYCSFQVSEFAKDLKWLSSSKVNDGICDCCDGSDEWAGVTVLESIHFKDNKAHAGLYQAPCRDHCEELRARRAAMAKVRAEGAKQKQLYIDAAKGVDNTNMQYGPDGVFYKLSTSCYEAKQDKYTYSVCPFKEIKQIASPESPTVIGRTPVWASQGLNGYILKMTDGDKQNCPEGVARVSEIEFECGTTDEVTRVQEGTRCEYLFKFSTPAAC